MIYPSSKAVPKAGTQKSSERRKKKLTQEDLGLIDDIEPKPKRKLRKLREIEPQSEEEEEQFIEQPNKQSSSEEQQVEVVEHKHFAVQDDEDLKKELQAKSKKGTRSKSNKQLKNNLAIDKFMTTKRPSIQEPKQEKKSKVAVVQPKIKLSAAQISQRKKQLRKEKREQQEQIQMQKMWFADQPLSGNSSEEEDDLAMQTKRAQMYSIYNDAEEDHKTIGSPESVQKNTKPQFLNQQHRNQPKKSSEPLRHEKSTVPQQVSVPAEDSKPQERQESIFLFGEFEPVSKQKLASILKSHKINCSFKMSPSTTTVVVGSYSTDKFGRKIDSELNQSAELNQLRKKGVKVVENCDVDKHFSNLLGISIKDLVTPEIKKTQPMEVEVRKLQPMDVESLNKVEDIIKQQEKPEIRKQIVKPTKNIEERNNSIAEVKKQLFKETPKPKQTVVISEAWTEKYKPKSPKDIIGHFSQIKTLKQWLLSWHDIHINGNKRNIKGKTFNLSNNINAKAALLSGDPGLGKTTTALLLAEELGFTVVEYNASDVRNKKGINSIEISKYGLQQKDSLSKPLIIMDEVDGMSSGDRGGITAIIGMIKAADQPIICICNDRNSEKIRSLANHCLDIKFHKQDKAIIMSKLNDIVSKQKGKVADRVMAAIIEMFQSDIRQILNYLELLFKTVSKNITLETITQNSKYTKDSSVMLNAFEATRRLTNRLMFMKMSIQERIDLFFIDHGKIPLLMQENYLETFPKGKTNVKKFHLLVKASNSFAMGDLLDRKIQNQQVYSLLPNFGFLSSVYPAELVSENLGFPAFPCFLGKFSAQRKNRRLTKELKRMISPKASCNNESARSSYSVLLFQELVELLKQGQISSALNLMEEYNIDPKFFNEDLATLQFNPKKENLLSEIPTAVKGKLTKEYNKRHQDSMAKKKGKGKGKAQEKKEDVEPVSEEEEEDDSMLIEI